MMQSFQVEICDRDGRVVLIGKVSGFCDGAFQGEVIRDDLPQKVRDVLQAFALAAEDSAMRECAVLFDELRALDLQVTGIPGKETAARVQDFQLGADGSFALRVD